MTLNFEQALALAKKKLIQFEEPEYELIIMLEQTITRPYGWIFFYDSKKFIETGDFSYAIAGNLPFLVDIHGNIHESKPLFDIDTSVLEFDKRIGNM